MAVVDDLRRLGQLDSIYLGHQVTNYLAPNEPNIPVTSWYKGRLQQANDGTWIFRSISADGTVCGFQLGAVQDIWQSSEAPASGIQVSIPINLLLPGAVGAVISHGSVLLQQELPPELTN